MKALGVAIDDTKSAWLAALSLLAFLLTASCVRIEGGDRTNRLMLPSLYEDVAQTRKFVLENADAVWPGLSNAPFGILLVEEKGETLLCDERLPDGFARLPQPLVEGCAAATGPSSWRSPKFLAAMPAFGPPSVIVIGTPATTNLTDARWKMTLMHEHFHQWQSALPEYYTRVAALDLAGGDESGMWMINYPFPYDNPKVANAYARSATALYAALGEQDDMAFAEAVSAYLATRQVFQDSVSEADWRYFEFQLWQEGVARWTEIELGRMHPSASIRQAAVDVHMRVLENLRTQDLAANGRLAVYDLGAAEAMLLERHKKGWRKIYPSTLALGGLLQ